MGVPTPEQRAHAREVAGQLFYDPRTNEFVWVPLNEPLSPNK